MADGDKAIKGTTGWYTFAHSLSTTLPKRLTRSRNARRGMRALKGKGR
jgi:hypothetical protein